MADIKLYSGEKISVSSNNSIETESFFDKGKKYQQSKKIEQQSSSWLDQLEDDLFGKKTDYIDSEFNEGVLDGLTSYSNGDFQTYSDGVLHGPYYYKGESGNYFEGLLEGEIIQDSEQFQKIIHYSSGIKHGEEQFLDKNTGEIYITNWNKGILHGELRVIYPTGSGEVIGNFTDGLRDGIFTTSEGMQKWKMGKLILLNEI